MKDGIIWFPQSQGWSDWAAEVPPETGFVNKNQTDEMKQHIQAPVAGYRILRKLGSGEHGTIYLGCKRDGPLTQLAAIKKVSEHGRASNDSEFRLLPTLDHPNIIKCLEDEREDNSLVLEYASGGDLHSYAQQKYEGPVPQDVLVKWLCQICLALHYLHHQVRVLHRDIKATNILVMENGLLKLGDFGTARQLQRHEDFANTAVGTPFYLSPEAVGLSKYNSKSDVWGLGCVMYELCTGQKPFMGSSLNDLIRQILNQQVPDIPETYSEWFRTLVKSMLQKNLEKRITVENILERGEIRQVFTELKQEFQKDYKQLVYPIVDPKTKKNKDRDEMSRISFCAESLKTVKNQKSSRLEALDWKNDERETEKKESKKVEFDKFKDRSLKSIIERRKLQTSHELKS